MLLPKHKDGGGGWKAAASSRLPTRKSVVSFLTRTRLIYVLIAGLLLLFWRAVSSRHGMDRSVPRDTLAKHRERRKLTD